MFASIPVNRRSTAFWCKCLIDQPGPAYERGKPNQRQYRNEMPRPSTPWQIKTRVVRHPDDMDVGPSDARSVQYLLVKLGPFSTA
jgi:hypothetical protein